MTHSFVVYIDESGDEGFTFSGQGKGVRNEWHCRAFDCAEFPLDRVTIFAKHHAAKDGIE
jgi:hypothetical protein